MASMLSDTHSRRRRWVALLYALYVSCITSAHQGRTEWRGEPAAWKLQDGGPDEPVTPNPIILRYHFGNFCIKGLIQHSPHLAVMLAMRAKIKSLHLCFQTTLMDGQRRPNETKTTKCLAHGRKPRYVSYTKIVPIGDWGHLPTLTLTSDDLESHIVINVSSTLTNSTIWFVAAFCLIVDVRTDGHFTGFIRSSQDSGDDLKWVIRCACIEDNLI